VAIIDQNSKMINKQTKDDVGIIDITVVVVELGVLVRDSRWH
jgi:hypothetical protein